MSSPVEQAHLDVIEASAEDRDAIGRLSGLPAGTLGLLDRDLVASDTCCLVARRGGEVVGYLAARVQADEVHVTDVAVALTWRRQGVATTLFHAMTRRMRDRGLTMFTLEVAEHNRPARALYRRLGFAVEGRRPRYYPDGDDALILWLKES